MAKTPTLGKGDWTDYQDYWRDDDAEWLMERTVLRYDTDTLRNSEWPNPTAGQVIYNASVGTLQVRSASGWLNLFSADHLVGTADATQVILSFDAAANKGIAFKQTSVVATLPFTTNSGEVTMDTTGLTIKTAATAAKLTTDATSLVINKPINVTGGVSATGLGLSGTANIAGLITAQAGVSLTGGNLTLFAAPTATMHAATKAYCDGKLPLTGGAITGPLTIDLAAGGFCLNLKADNSYLAFYNGAGTTREGYIQGTTSNHLIYFVDAVGALHLFYVGGQEIMRFGYSSGGYASINGHLDISTYLTVASTATISGRLYASGAASFYGPGGVSLLDVGGGNTAYMQFFGNASSMTNAGTRTGYFGFPTSTSLMVQNEISGGAIQLRTTGAGDVYFVPGAGGEILFYPNGTYYGKMYSTNFLWGKAASDVHNVGLEFQGSYGRILSTTDYTCNLYCHHVGGTDVNGAAFIQFLRGGTTQLLSEIRQLTTTGVTIVNCTISAPSDYRWKDDLGPVTGALDRVMELQPKRLRWKESGVLFDGFVAHEAGEVLPYLLVGEKDAVDEHGRIEGQGFDYAGTTPLLAAAIQELTARVQALESAA